MSVMVSFWALFWCREFQIVVIWGVFFCNIKIDSVWLRIWKLFKCLDDDSQQGTDHYLNQYWLILIETYFNGNFNFKIFIDETAFENVIVRRAGLLWSQQDFEWRWSVPLFKCLTVLEFSFILFDLCLLITFFNFIMNYVPIVTFWIFTYHKIWILSIMFCFIWSYWIIYFLACLEVSWRVVS